MGFIFNVPKNNFTWEVSFADVFSKVSLALLRLANAGPGPVARLAIAHVVVELGGELDGHLGSKGPQVSPRLA